jgi:hypothetical protein
MPWTKDDVEKHKKGLTDKQKETWVKVANSARNRCIEAGGSEKECDASAIRQANKAAGDMKEYRAYTMSTNNVLLPVNAIDVDGEPVPVAELVAAYQEQRGQGQGQGGPRQGDGGADMCVCPDCGREFPHKKGTPCNEQECPDCGVALTGKQEEVAEATTKTVDGKSYPAGDFLVVEDPEKPSTWHLPVKRNGKPDHSLMGAAKAALTSPGGHRGNKYEGPNKQQAISKLKALYKSEDMAWNEKASEADVAKARELLEQALAVLGQKEIAEVELAESAAGHAVGLSEDAKAGPRAPLMINVALIRPGFGNKKDNHYYPREVLERDAKVFEGVKMYATDHRPEEKSVRTEVAVIKTCPIAFTDDGAPIAQVAVHDGDFAEQTRNRAELGTLDTLECSILASGRVKKGQIDGKEANIVEAITRGQSVDWVTKAGAGGHALNLAENDDGGISMSEENKDQETSQQVEEATLSENQEEAQGQAPLEESAISELLAETNLPSASKKRLAKGQYEDESALREAILAEIEYVKTLTGSGQPFGQGTSQAQAEQRPLEERLAEIDKRYGIQAIQEA